MRVLHGTTLVWGVLGTLAALAMIRVQSALDAWWKMQGIFAGGMLGLFLLGLLAKRATSRAAMIGVAVGVVLIAWLALSGQTVFHEHLTIVFGTIIVVLTGFLIGVLQRRESV